MQNLVEVTSIVGFFILRLGIPICVMVLLAWWLRRLDARWQAEAEDARLQALDASLPPLLDEAVDEQPCWEQRGCSIERRERCAAFARPAVPCWLARMDAEGALPDNCPACGIFHLTREARVIAGD